MSLGILILGKCYWTMGRRVKVSTCIYIYLKEATERIIFFIKN